MRVGDAEPLAHLRRIVGDEDVGLRGQPMQHRLALGLGEIEREALLVAGFQHPREIMLAMRVARQVRQVAIGIAGDGRLDLDDVGAEIRQHRGGGRRGDKACAVQNLEAVENTLVHRGVAP